MTADQINASGKVAVLDAIAGQQPVERSTVADQVAQRIIALIKAGNLKAGDRLPTEAELGQAFQLSRPSIREGLKMLRVLGIVESRQGGRYYITDLSTNRLIKPIEYIIMLPDYDPRAHVEARLAVDLALVRLACERATDDEVDKINSLAEAGHGFVSDPVGFRLLDVEFHKTINDAARSPMLTRISESLYELGFEYRRVASEMPGVIAKSLADHDIIASAITNRQPERAEAAFRTHLANVLDTTLAAQAVIGGRSDDESSAMTADRSPPIPTRRASE